MPLPSRCGRPRETDWATTPPIALDVKMFTPHNREGMEGVFLTQTGLLGRADQHPSGSEDGLRAQSKVPGLS